MLTNAFEATEHGGEVKLQVDCEKNGVTFSVWSRRAIPNHLAERIFQRNFTTKKEPGRGLGTYAMKLFGEHYLGGKVDFETSESYGTVFRLWVPSAEPGNRQNTMSGETAS
jgi:signal transduction histidine kinase